MDPAQPYVPGMSETTNTQTPPAPQAEMPQPVAEKPKLHDAVALCAILGVILVVVLSFAFFFWYLNMQGDQVAGLKPNVTVNSNNPAQPTTSQETTQKQLANASTKASNTQAVKTQLDTLDGIVSSNTNTENSDYTSFSSDLNNSSIDTTDSSQAQQL